MTDLRNQVDATLLAQQMRASFGEVGARVIANLEARVCSLETSNGKRATETLALDSADVKYHKALASEYRRALSEARTQLEEMKRVDNARIAECTQIPAMRAELERLRKMTSMSVGVGDGTGQLFVHGDYDSVKVAQAKLLELAELRRAKDQRSRHWGDGTGQLFVERADRDVRSAQRDLERKEADQAAAPERFGVKP